MSNYVIFTDNSCELSPSDCAKYDLQRVMIEFYFPDTEIEDPDDVDGFYKILRPNYLSKTSATNPQQFIDAFKPFLDAGNDILYFGLMRGLSVTIDNCLLAIQELTTQYPDRRIVGLDSRCVSGGLGYLAMEAAKKRLSGHNMDDVIAHIESIKMSIVHDFTVDKLDYLHAGGRVSKLAQVVGEALGVRPILHVNYEEEKGKGGDPEKKDRLVKRTQARGKKQTLRIMSDRIAANIQRSDDGSPIGAILISHGDCLDKAQELSKLIHEALPNIGIEFTRMGGVIGTHCGPTVMGAFYLGYER